MIPLILIDVDGVLNLLFSERDPAGLVEIDARPGKGRFRLLLDPLHGEWLKKLAQETGAELAWGSTWEDHANTWVGPHIGLPRLPAAPVRDYGKRSVIAWTQDRPFVWFDDDEAVIGTADSAPAGKGILVSLRTGLTEDHIREARQWLPGKQEAPEEV